MPLPIEHRVKRTVLVPVLCQAKSITVDFFAEPADVVTNLVVNFGELLFGLLRHFNYIELRINVTCSSNVNSIGIILNCNKLQLKNISVVLLISQFDMTG